MLWFTYYKGTFSTFVFASQNRAFMLRSVLRTLRPYMRLTQTLTHRGQTPQKSPSFGGSRTPVKKNKKKEYPHQTFLEERSTL
jgi:hypothetical protein